jgi:2-C-methyl-D-erythritol 4-phosphate cytidylyltransferase
MTIATPQSSASPNARYVALIPAAGVGARMGGAVPKQYLTLGGKTILQHTLEVFLAAPQIEHVYLVVSAEDAYVADVLEILPDINRLSILRCGGASRRDSVSNGLAAITGLRADDWVLVHDAARPGLTVALIDKLIAEVANHAVGGLLALPVVDTVKRLQDGKLETVARAGLWLAQTPQMFRYQLLRDALAVASEVTDEASAIEAAGYTPLLVEGHARNMKLTMPEDIALMRLHLEQI